MSETRDGNGWTELEALWRDDVDRPTVDVADLRRRVGRRVALTRVLLVTELGVGVSALAVARSFAAAEGGPLGVATVVTVAAFVVAALAFSIANRRGFAAASVLEPADYLDFTRRRLAARRRSLVFGIWLLATETVFFLWWIPTVGGAGRPWRYLLLAALAGGATLVLAWLWRSGRRQEGELRRLERELGD